MVEHGDLGGDAMSARTIVDGRWRVTLVSSPQARRPSRGPMAAVVVCVVLLASVLLAPVAVADTSGQIDPVLNVSPPGVRSVLITTPEGSNPDMATNGCSPGTQDGIGFPNGVCNYGPVDITNGDAPSAIGVSATDFSRNIAFTSSSNELGPQVPIQGGDNSGDTAPWQLCSVSDGHGYSDGGPWCTAAPPPGGGVIENYPGIDQAWLRLVGSGDDTNLAASTTLGANITCDEAWAPDSCWADPDTESIETLTVVGPTSTTDNAYGMWALITFTALPGFG
jgi:hypothetical protein